LNTKELQLNFAFFRGLFFLFTGFFFVFIMMIEYKGTKPYTEPKPYIQGLLVFIMMIEYKGTTAQLFGLTVY